MSPFCSWSHTRVTRSVNFSFKSPFWLLEPYPGDEKCKLFSMSPFWLMEPFPKDEKHVSKVRNC